LKTTRGGLGSGFSSSNFLVFFFFFLAVGLSYFGSATSYHDY